LGVDAFSQTQKLRAAALTTIHRAPTQCAARGLSPGARTRDASIAADGGPAHRHEVGPARNQDILTVRHGGKRCAAIDQFTPRGFRVIGSDGTVRLASQASRSLTTSMTPYMRTQWPGNVQT
jgi:hypothetical protein